MTRPRPKLGTIAIAVCLVATPAAAAEITHTPRPNGPEVISNRRRNRTWRRQEIHRDRAGHYTGKCPRQFQRRTHRAAISIGGFIRSPQL